MLVPVAVAMDAANMRTTMSGVASPNAPASAARTAIKVVRSHIKMAPVPCHLMVTMNAGSAKMRLQHMATA